MARILGVDIPDNKRGEIALTHIYGIGRNLSKKILTETKVGNKKVLEWSDEDLNKVRTYISDHYSVEGDLRTEIRMNIKFLQDIRCYRGMRHILGLPVRGQRTKITLVQEKEREKQLQIKRRLNVNNYEN
jgi:small subunit ribosomal protein S13